MDNAEVMEMLQGLPRRSVYKLRVVRFVTGVIFVSCSMFAICDLYAMWPWTRNVWVIALLAGVFYCASQLLINDPNYGWLLSGVVAWHPEIVYWAHAGSPFAAVPAIETNCEVLTLHLRNGEQLDVTLPASKMQDFIAWLCAANPTIRWGAFDQPADDVNAANDTP